MNLRANLLLPTALLSLLLILFIVVIASLGFDKQKSNQLANNNLEKMGAEFIVKNAIDVLLNTTKIIQSSGSFVNSIELENKFEVFEIIYPFADQPMVDFVMVYDRQYEIFSRSDDPGDFGHKDFLFLHVKKTIELNQSQYIVIPFNGFLTIIYISPLNSINGISGGLAVGRYIDEKFVNLFQAEHKTKLIIKYQNKSWPDSHEERALIPIKSFGQLKNSDIEFFISQPDTYQQSELKNKLLILLLVAVILSLIILYYSYNSIISVSDRISWVAKSAGLLEKGNFPPLTKDIQSKDEIGIMVEAISKANIAINLYLAEISRTIKKQESTNAELHQARDKALEMVAAKSEFLSNMSHEIRTPMNGVLGMLRSLGNSELNDEQRYRLDIARDSAESLLIIINDILDYSKIEAGKLDLELVTFDFQELCENVTELLANKCHDQDLDLLLRYVPGTPKNVIGDPGRIRQILLNLLSNAIKFTSEGYILLSVELEKSSIFRVSVRDTGIGIAQDKQNLVFNKFDQADTSTTRKYGGTGLGLSICQQLSKLMGGDISLESDFGKGSIFTVTIKLACENKPEVENDNIDYSNLSGQNALIADSSEISRNIIIEQLEPLNLNLDSVSTGEEAFTKICQADENSNPYTILFVLNQLSDMSGEKLVNNINHHASLERIMIIYVTSSPNINEEIDLNKIGVDGYLSKPTFPLELGKVLLKIRMAKLHRMKIPLVTRHDIRETMILSAVKPEFDDAQILVAEDNAVNQMVATELLEGYGCVVTPAGNGVEAFSMFSRNQFDLILMDCQMPEMDGFEATGKIRERELLLTLDRTPVIAFTANAMQGDSEKCLTAGMDDYISKPVNPLELETILKKWVSAKLIEPSGHQIKAIKKNSNAFSLPPSLGELDLIVFNNLKALFRQKFPDAIRKHRITLTGNIEKAEIAIKNNDPQALSAVMHSIKSSSRQFGATSLGDLAELIETIALDKDLSDINEHFDKLVVMQVSVLKEMDNEIYP